MSEIASVPVIHDSEILLPEQLDALLGIHPRTRARWYRLATDPLKPSRPGGNRVYFLRSEVVAWLKRQQHSPGQPRAVRKKGARAKGRRA